MCLSSFTQHYWIKLSLIVQDSSLLAKKPGPYLSPSVADHPLRTAKDHRLGRLLPYQQPNLAQAHPKTALAFVIIQYYQCKAFFKRNKSFKYDYPKILGQILVYYSPIRHGLNHPTSMCKVCCKRSSWARIKLTLKKQFF